MTLATLRIPLALSMLLACGEPITPAADITGDALPDALGDSSVADVPLDALGPDGSGVDTAEHLPCDPPLALGPSEPIVPIYGTLQVLATGGTGAYRFTIKDDASGAVVNPLTGSFLAGGVGGVTDVVALEDLGCLGEAQLGVSVVPDPILNPTQATVPPKACLQFSVTGGSGEFSYEIVSGTPMGSVDETGLYVAGKVSGSDVIRVRDMKTEQINDAVVIIDPGSDLTPYPERVFVPLGSIHQVPVTGGSSDYELTSDSEAVTIEGDDLYGANPGTSIVTVTDKNVFCVGSGAGGYLETEIEVTIVPSLNLPGTAHGSGGWPTVVRAGDLDGDGIPDVVIGMDRSHHNGFRSGAVFVFKGTPTGLEKTPSWVGTPPYRLSYYGRNIIVRDLDGDGQKDLLVAASEDYMTGPRFGAVTQYRGVEGGFFEEAPERVWVGTEAYEHFGSSLNLCDFDGDGYEDLAVGAERAEDEEPDKVSQDQGSVMIFRGSAEGLSDTPSQEIFGKVNNMDGQWEAMKSFYFGQIAAAGDYNGDGYCDLVAGTRSYVHAGGGNAGALALFLGGEDGLADEPSIAWAGIDLDDKSSFFGYSLLMADVNQDGRSDLLVGQRDHSDEEVNNRGALRVFLGTDDFPIEGAYAYLSPGVADWTALADQGGDRIGYWIDVFDVTGDGIPDLLASSGYEEAVGFPGGTGTISVFRGTEQGLPDLEPIQMIAGETGSDIFGGVFAAIGDLDGDNRSELVSIALGADYEGPNTMRTYMVWGRGEASIPWGGQWKYLDSGEDPGTEWMNVDYDDSAWAEGPAQLGYGEDDEATLVNEAASNLYLRRTLNLEAAVSFFEFIVRYDDGFAVWVNEELVHTVNIAEGDEGLLFVTPASAAADNALVRFSLEEEGLNPFVPGENVVAVMVKQASNPGGDLSFDMELSVYGGAGPAEGALEVLNVPVTMSNDQNGRSVAIVKDITNDSYQDLWVGAPGAAPDGYGAEAGQIHLYQGTTSGTALEPFKSLSSFLQTANGIEVGRVVGSAGDFDGDGKQDFAFLARETSQPAEYDPQFYKAPEACLKAKNSVGAAYVFIGGPGAGYTSNEPAFIVYGPEVNRDPETMAGGFDIDGDGYDDIAIGSRTFRGDSGLNNAGGIAIFRGKPDTPGRVTIICEHHAFFVGVNEQDQMGRAIAPLGKIDDDDCDELAFGTDLDDLNEQTNQGSVRVVFGWGPKCNSPYPRIVTLVPNAPASRFGWSIDGGEDLDGDDVPDLLVGAPDYREGNLRVGAAFVISGAYIGTLEADTTITGDLPSNPKFHPLAPVGQEPWMIRGTRETSSGNDMAWFGSSVAFVPGLKGGVGVAVGAFHGDGPGIPLVGDVRVWTFDDGEFSLLAAVGGETPRPGSRFGEFIDAGLIGGNPTLVIGAWYGSPHGFEDRVDNGSVYVINLKN